MEDNLKKIMQPKTIKTKNNGCGTDPGNLVVNIYNRHFPFLTPPRGDAIALPATHAVQVLSQDSFPPMADQTSPCP